MTDRKTCIGFGAKEGKCSNEAGTPWTPLWCAECDQERRDKITEQMQKISRSFTGARDD